MKISPRLKGSGYEKLAEKYLRSRGLKVIARNFHCRLGEIDLILRDRDTIVFVEVRFRANSRFGSATQSVTASKQRKIISTAKLFLGKHGLNDKLYCRFDVLGIEAENDSYRYQWLTNAFSSDDGFQ